MALGTNRGSSGGMKRHLRMVLAAKAAKVGYSHEEVLKILEFTKYMKVAELVVWVRGFEKREYEKAHHYTFGEGGLGA